MPNPNQLSERETVAAVVDDACLAQRQRGEMPTPDDNARFIAPILEKNDKRIAERKRRGLDNPPHKNMQELGDKKDEDLGALQREYEKRMRAKGLDPLNAKIVSRETKPVSPQVKSDWMLEYGKRMRLRFRTLRAHPTWAAKIRPYCFAATGTFGHEQQQFAIQKLKEIVEDSNRHFGDWRKWPEPPKSFSG